MNTRHTMITTVALAVVIGVAITFGPSLWETDGQAEPASITADLGARLPGLAPELVEILAGLQQDLHTQRKAQENLEAQLAELRAEQRALAGYANPAVIANPEANPEADASTDAAAAIANMARLGRFGDRAGTVSEDRLIEVGFAAHQAREIVSRADAIAMERLNLQYRAVREGWIDTDQFRDSLASLPDVREVITADYGDDAYDRYLYAAGRPNRLIVRDVIQDSPAGAAGLQPGDRVIAMADERIYSTRDLMEVASAGSPGESVPLLVERGDAVFELYVPRGPLGIRGDRGFENPAGP